MASAKEYEMLFKLNAQLGGAYNAAFAGARTPIARLQSQIEAIHKTQSNVASYIRQQQAVDNTTKRLQMLQSQYDNIQKEMGETGGSSSDLQNRLLQKQLQIDKTSKSLGAQKEALKASGTALKAAGVDTNNLAGASEKLAGEVEKLSEQQEEAAEAASSFGENTGIAVANIQQALAAAGVVAAFKKVYDAMAECAQESIAFESAMAGVAKTTDLTDSELADLGDALKDLSTDIPVTAEGLAGIGEVAGQLGIRNDDLKDFTTTMAMLSTATTMSAQEGATLLAQFSAITQMDPKDYDNLASAIVDLGNNFATTEQRITEMSQGIAASADIAGMSEADIAGLSAAVTSLGIETQAGSTSMATLIQDINKAVETGKGLEDWARIANMSGSQFKEAWGDDASGALIQFIDGLDDVERNGESASVVLDKLGISEVRQVRMLLSLANAGDLLTNAVDTANNAWDESTALAAEAEKRYGTTASKLQMAENAATNLKIAIGDNLTPAVGGVAEVWTNVLTGVTEFIEKNPVLIQALMAAAAVFGTVTIGIIAYTAAAKVAAAVSALLTASIPGLNIIMAVAAGVAALAAGYIALSAVIEASAYDFEKLNEEYDSITSEMEENNAVSDLIDEYDQLNKELSDTSGLQKQGAAMQSVTDKANTLKGLDGTKVSLSAEMANTLAAEGFLDGTTVTLTAEQANVLKAEGFLEGDTVKLTAEQANTLLAAGYLDGSTVELTAEQANVLAAAGYLDTTTVPLTAELSLGGYDTVEAKLLALQGKLEETKTSLETEKTTLTELEGKYAGLQELYNGTKKKKEKTAIEEQMGALNLEIDAQKTKVGDLDGAYIKLNEEYEATKTAADELTAKQDRLSEVKQQLIDKSGGLITATADETAAFDDQVRALDALNDAQKTEARTKAYENLRDQAQGYVQSLREEEKYTGLLAQSEAARSAVTGDSLRAEKNKVVDIYNDLAMKSGEFFDTTEGAAYWNTQIAEASRLVSIISGVDQSFSGSGLSGLGFAMEEYGISASATEEAWSNANKEIADYQAALDAADGTQKTFLDNLVAGIQAGGMEMEDIRRLLTEQFAGEENGMKIVADAMAYVNEALAAAAEADALAESTEDAATTSVELMDAIKDVTDEMEKLSDAYEKAYTSAYDSMDGQFGLFDKVSVKATTSIKQMLDALNSQSKYMGDYGTNLQKAAEMGLSDGLIQQLSDGSVESAAYLQTIVKGGEDKIAELNAAFAKVEEGKDTFATTVAELQTDFTTKMGELQTQLETAISEMNLNTEAAQAGRDTVQGFIDGADEKIDDVVAAYTRVGSAALAAIKAALGIESPSKEMKLQAYYTMMGFINETEALTPELAQTMYEAALAGKEAFGSGSSLDAEPYTESTSTIYEGRNITITFSPMYNITGAGNPEDTMSLIHAHDEELREFIIDTMEEHEADTARREFK